MSLLGWMLLAEAPRAWSQGLPQGQNQGQTKSQMIDFTVRPYQANSLAVQPQVNRLNPPIHINVRPFASVQDELTVQVFLLSKSSVTKMYGVHECYIFKVPSTAASEIVIHPAYIQARLNTKLADKIAKPGQEGATFTKTSALAQGLKAEWMVRLLRGNDVYKETYSLLDVRSDIHPGMLQEAVEYARKWDLGAELMPQQPQ